MKLLELRDHATAPTPSFGPRHVSCAAVHPAIDSCLSVPFDRFFEVFKWMLPIYGALHFIPTILFKRKEFFRQPLKMLLKAGWGTTRSSAFLGTFVIIYQSTSTKQTPLRIHLTAGSRRVLLQTLLVRPIEFAKELANSATIRRAPHFQSIILGTWIFMWVVSVCRGPQEASRVGDVRLAQGVGKCLDYGQRQRPRFQDWQIRRRHGES